MSNITEILHAIPVDPLTGSIAVPIYQTSTFVQDAPGVNKGFDYSRSNNPTRKVLEDLIAKLENGHSGFAFASGLAAVDTVLKVLESGDEIVAVDDIYGGTYRLLTQVYQKFGIKIKFVDTSDAANLARAVTSRTKLVWLETPTNPTLKICDIAAISKIAHERGAFVVVDNTFASPALQRPIDLGADIVLHSATKYIAGHSDVIAGLVVVNTPYLAERIKFYQNACGSILGPFDSWLTIRGIETLELRTTQQSANALKIAEQLQHCPHIDKIYYPGLKSHPNHDIAARQQKNFGSIISFSLKKDTIEAANKVVTSTRLFKLAESLGGVKSLVAHPAQMTHKSIPSEVRQANGVQDSLIRLSVGIETAEDLLADVLQAIEKSAVIPSEALETIA